MSQYIGRASLARENEAGDSWGQEVHILHVNVSGANVYMCYDYVHLDNFSDISAHRNHNV